MRLEFAVSQHSTLSTLHKWSRRIIGALAITVVASAAPTTAADDVIQWMHTATNADQLAIMQSAVAQYEAEHPGVKVDLQLLVGESREAKLVTMLQTDNAPDIFYSFGAGDLADQAKAGALRPINDLVDDATKSMVGEAGISAFTRDGNLYGLPENVSEVVLWYNKRLFAQAGLDPASMKDWSGFIAGIEKLKGAGITPIALGGKEKWPAHFWWAKLVTRLAGKDAFDAASRGEGEGFAGAPFVRAGQLFLDLAALKPFQDGFLAASYSDSSGHFGDSKAAMHFMGDWDYAQMKDSSADGKGISDEDLGILPFPTVEGGMGDATDTLGGLNGWAFSKDASDEAVKLVSWYLQKSIQEKFAAKSVYVPITSGASDAITNPFKRQIAQNINAAHWHAIFFDQALGPNVGAAVNDISAELSAQAITAEEAAQTVKDAVDSSM